MTKNETKSFDLNDLIELEEKGRLDQLEQSDIDNFVQNAHDITFNPVPTKESILEFAKTASRVFDVTNNFSKEYEDILIYVDTSSWEKAANITFEEMEEMTIRDIMERIRERHGIITPDSEWATKTKHENSLAKTLQMLDNIIPNKYIIPNNKLSNTLTKEGVELDMELNLIMNEKKEVFTKVYLNYDDENITIYDEGKKFTPYDRTVINAACSLYEAGNTNFTAKQVYRCMNGLNDTQDVSPQAVGAITKSLDKARRTYVKIDCTQEAAAYKNSTDFKCEIEDYILSAKKVTLTSGNEEVIGYALNSKPILYEYAQMSNQVLSVPSKLLNTKDVIRSTPEVIVIREYLIRRIEVMKNAKNNLGNKIALSSIYAEIGHSEPTKEKASKVRNSIEKLLGKYKKEKYIKDFEFYKEGRAFKGVQIKY